MSWSFQAVGKAAAVLEKARIDLPKINCPQPEETIKGNVLVQLEAALPFFPPGYAVKVTASGSQYAPDHTKPKEVVNSFELKIEPLWGFVE